MVSTFLVALAAASTFNTEPQSAAERPVRPGTRPSQSSKCTISSISRERSRVHHRRVSLWLWLTKPRLFRCLPMDSRSWVGNRPGPQGRKLPPEPFSGLEGSSSYANTPLALGALARSGAPRQPVRTDRDLCGSPTDARQRLADGLAAVARLPTAGRSALPMPPGPID